MPMATTMQTHKHSLYCTPFLYVSRNVKSLVFDDVVADIVLVEDLHTETFK